MLIDTGCCTKCGGKWNTQLEGKLRAPMGIPFHPQASVQVVCTNCFGELSTDEVVRLALSIVRETSEYKAMSWAKRNYFILDLQQTVECLKDERGQEPSDENAPVADDSH